ncbi:gluconate 2-dehydrogenase subunit 3 family protein [Paenibacillus hamazuiensis]|uniref:gluconate 2-dehydrogenase subunit 3 family protein n=1 Tax=Paenibacillus hamazuiensis TaxID=2936508 RepID=UPI00200F26B7|nr:gluconate 2-dehydrogenase subunit 3 family protein [Paenibacillus hamazuiensis]
MISSEEIRMIRRLSEAIFPGAAEARVSDFIVRDMQSNPFWIDLYRAGLKDMNEKAIDLYGTQLVELAGEQLNGLLAACEQSAFFRTIREHTLEGMFSDPIYGGNYEACGWRLVGYAGPTYHPPETIGEAKPPVVYYSLEGIAYAEKNGL